MMSGEAQRRHYDREFKLEAVRRSHVGQEACPPDNLCRNHRGSDLLRRGVVLGIQLGFQLLVELLDLAGRVAHLLRWVPSSLHNLTLVSHLSPANSHLGRDTSHYWTTANPQGISLIRV